MSSTSLPLKITAWAIALGLVALPVVGVMNGWFASDRWPFKQLRVDAEFQRINAEQVRAAVAPHTTVGFFAINLDDVRTSLEALPWVESVQVRKRWPDLLEIRLTERHPIAVWGDSRLVSTNGALFEVQGSPAPEGLPRLSGPDERVADVLGFYHETEAALDGSGLSVAGVSLSGRGSWSLDLSNGGVLVIGREAPEARLARFIDMLPRLEAPANAYWAKADLRYANGFALEWREAFLINDELPPVTGEPAPAVETPPAAPAAPQQSLLDQMLEEMPEAEPQTEPGDDAGAQA